MAVRQFKHITVESFSPENIQTLVETGGKDALLFTDDCKGCRQEFSVFVFTAVAQLKRYGQFIPPTHCRNCFNQARGVSTPTPPGNARFVQHKNIGVGQLPKMVDVEAAVRQQETLPLSPEIKCVVVSKPADAQAASGTVMSKIKSFFKKPKKEHPRQEQKKRPSASTNIKIKAAPPSKKIPWWRLSQLRKKLEGKYIRIGFKKRVSFSSGDESTRDELGICMAVGPESVTIKDVDAAAHEARTYAHGDMAYMVLEKLGTTAVPVQAEVKQIEQQTYEAVEPDAGATELAEVDTAEEEKPATTSEQSNISELRPNNGKFLAG